MSFPLIYPWYHLLDFNREGIIDYSLIIYNYSLSYIYVMRVFIHFITWWQLRTQTCRMSDHIITPRMDWNAPDLSETFALFQLQMRLYFSVRNIKIDKQLYNLLLALGANGLQIYNSWSLGSLEKNMDNVL